MAEKKEVFMPEDHMDKLYHSSNPLVRYVHNERLDSIIRFFPEEIGLKILDAGCGEGHLIERLRKRIDGEYYGIDLTEIAIMKAKIRLPGVVLKIGDILKLDFEDNFFDVVICTEVLEHIYNYKGAVDELKRVLKKGGRLILTFPNEFLWTVGRFLLMRRPVKVPDHLNSFNFKKIVNLVSLRVVKKKGLPFKLPFSASLTGLIIFEK